MILNLFYGKIIGAGGEVFNGIKKSNKQKSF